MTPCFGFPFFSMSFVGKISNEAAKGFSEEPFTKFDTFFKQGSVPQGPRSFHAFSGGNTLTSSGRSLSLCPTGRQEAAQEFIVGPTDTVTLSV